MINTIPGFLVFPTQGNVSRIYADTYSQEDRLKHLADLLQRMLEWQRASVEKINEITAVVNVSDFDWLVEVAEDVENLKTEMLAVQGAIVSLTTEISEVSDSLDVTNASVGTLSTDVDSLESSVAGLLSRVSAVETGLQNALTDVGVSVSDGVNTSINFSRTKNGLSENYGNIILKSSDASIEIDSSGSEVDFKAVAVNALQAKAVVVVTHGTNASMARPIGVGAVLWIGSATPANRVAGDIWAEV